MNMNEYLLALGWGGDREASARFEWKFRTLIGMEDANDFEKRDKFIRDFVMSTENGQEYAIPAEDPKATFVRTFAEFGKTALSQNKDLFVFYVLEDTLGRQYRIYVKPDAGDDEMPEYQVLCDGFEVPTDALIWFQQAVGCRMFVTEDRSEMMIEFPYQGPEELPVIM
jgi:hypothetical protein